MKRYIFPALLTLLLVAVSCTKEPAADCAYIEVSFLVQDFLSENVSSSSRSTRATTPASDEEKAIKNIYVFLFSSTQPVIKYNNADAATVGTWTPADGKVTIQKSQSETGAREVYVVANFPADMKPALDAVTTLTQLKAVLKTISPPWTLGSDIATTGLLMEGHDTHNFTVNNQLQTIPLTRAVAKVYMIIDLDTKHQWPLIDPEYPKYYGYKYLDWGTQTWVLEKADAQTAADIASHTNWQTISEDAFNTRSGGGTRLPSYITNFSLTAYINEYDNSADNIAPVATVEVKMPYNYNYGSIGGFLPPPEFGDGDIYRLKLPLKVKRNTLYQYDIEIAAGLGSD